MGFHEYSVALWCKVRLKDICAFASPLSVPRIHRVSEAHA
jgi:hypothetical protein